MTMRLSMSSLAGTARTLVAVGTLRLAAMFCAVRAAAPRSLLRSASARRGRGRRRGRLRGPVRAAAGGWAGARPAARRPRRGCLRSDRRGPVPFPLARTGL